MLILTKTYTRPAEDIPWHGQALAGVAEFEQHLADVYASKIMYKYVTRIDPLTLRYTMGWDSQESYEQYINDDFLKAFWKSRDEYNKNVGIIAEPANITIIK